MTDRLALLITVGVAVVLVFLTAFHRAQALRAARAQPKPSPEAEAEAEAEAGPSHGEGRIAWLRLVGLVIWSSLIGYFTNPDWMAWSRLALPSFVPWIGAAIAILSVPNLLWVLRHLGPNLSSGVAPRPFHQLVKTGPYGWVRHPWYAALMLFLVGLSLLWSSWLLALLTGVRAIYFVGRSRVEERNLIDFFGDSYRDYMRRVPKFLPGLRGNS